MNTNRKKEVNETTQNLRKIISLSKYSIDNAEEAID